MNPDVVAAFTQGTNPDEFMQNLNAGRQAQPAPQAQAQPQGSRGGIMGFLSRAASDIAKPFEYFGKVAVVNPTRELAARATGNNQAFANAQQAARQTLVGSNNKISGNANTNAANFLKQLAGNAAQVGADVMPGGSGLLGMARAAAKAGAVGGAGAALTNNQDPLVGALEGAAGGAILGPIAKPVIGSVGRLIGFGGRAAAPVAAEAAPAATEAATQAGAGGVRGNLNNEFQNIRASAGGYQAGAKLPGSGPAGISLKQSQNLAALEDKHGIPAASPSTKLGYIQNKLNDTGQHIDQALAGAGEVPINQQDLQAIADSHLQNLNTNPQMIAAGGTGLTGHTQNLVDAFLGRNPAAADIAKVSGGQITQQDLANMAPEVRNQILQQTGAMAGGESPIKNAADLNQFIRGLDNRINYLRSEGSNVPGEQQAAQLFRQHLSDQLNKLVPDVSAANKAYAELKQLEAPALMENNRLSQTGGSLTNRFLNNNLVKGAEAKVGQMGQRLTAPAEVPSAAAASTGANGALPSTTAAAPAPSVTPGPVTTSATPVEGEVVNPGAQNSKMAMQAARTRATNIGPGGVIGAMAAGGGGQQQQGQSPIQQPPSTGADLTSMGTGASDLTQGAQAASLYPIQNMMADIQRDPAKASTYMDLYKMMNPTSSTAGKLSTAETNNVDALRSAAASLDTYMQQVGAAGQVGPGTAQIESTLAGMPILNRLVGQQGANIRGIEAQRTDIASMLAKSLTGSARPAASIIKKWEESIPNVTDTPQVAQQKYANLTQQINNRLKLAQIPAGQNVDISQFTGGQ